MIVFDLVCRTGGHRFEGWFGSSEDFAGQQDRGLLSCPQCGSFDVAKAVMAPSVGKKGNQRASVPTTGKSMSNAAIPPEVVKAMTKLAEMQSEALKSSRWVGDKFAEDARAMHYGERKVEVIHGQATLEEAKSLVDEGIGVAPLPFPVVPPDKAN